MAALATENDDTAAAKKLQRDWELAGAIDQQSIARLFGRGRFAGQRSRQPMADARLRHPARVRQFPGCQLPARQNAKNECGTYAGAQKRHDYWTGWIVFR